MWYFTAVIALSAFAAISYGAENCVHLQIEAGGTLPNGTYTVDHQNQSVTVYCQFYEGYGYTYLSTTTSGPIDMSAFYDTTDHVIIQHKRPDGFQYKTKFEQLPHFNDTPISIQFNSYVDYKSPKNVGAMPPYIFVGFIPINLTVTGEQNGWMLNGDVVDFTNCNADPNSYFTLLFDHDDVGYIASSHDKRYVVWAWYPLATQVPSSEEVPDEFLTPYIEVHQGGCGGYRTGNEAEITGVTVGVKFVLPSVPCLTPDDVAGATFTHDGTDVGMTVTYTCDSIYSLVSGDLVRTCINGWTGDLPVCGADGGWTDWSSWEACPVSCGGANVTRTRTCTDPAPLNGADCVGETNQTTSCNTQECPIDGNWSDWSYGPCSVTCGYGSRSKTRSCDNPAPAHGGQDCIGSDTGSDECIERRCPGTNQCGNGRFTCESGTMKCIADNFRCDCQDDCDDGSDEDVTWAGCDADKCSAAVGLFAGSLAVWYSVYLVFGPLF